MINNIKQVRDFYAQSAKTVSAKNALKQIEKLNSVLKQARTQGASDDYLYRLGEQGKIAVQNDYRISRAEESGAYQKQLEQIKSKYQKDYLKDFQLRDFQQRQFERKLQAMDDKQLSKFALDFIEEKIQFDDPAEIDILIVTLKDKSLFEEKGLEPLITAAQMRNSSEPWLNSDDAKILTQKIGMLDLPDFAMADDEGRSYAIDFSDLFDAFDTSKDGEGEDE
ncbi:MAG: hypothetical protein A2001_11090 [Treponema sp. GWC1_61_84]|nr:MAG: hypothetical protein A2001_11090 [Treponema sp. GWC1_61_84]